MIEKAYVCWYRIQKCGFFASTRTRVPVFGALPDTLASLQSWSSSKRLGGTATFEPSEDGLPVYLADIRSHGTAWLLTLWNETPSSEGKVASVSAASAVGDAEVFENEVKEGTIPGFATYFYFVPEISAVAAIRFQHMAFGHTSMRKYVDSFLKRCSPHAVYGPVDADRPDELTLLGYSERKGLEILQSVPLFKSEVASLPGEYERIVQAARQIVKVRRREVINMQVHQERAWWQSILGRAGLGQHPIHAQSARVQYDLNELEDTFQPEDVQQIIDAWAAEQHVDEWADIGFVLKGQSGHTYWLSHSGARGQVHLEVTRRKTEIIEPESLLAELVRHDGTLRALLNRPAAAAAADPDQTENEEAP